MSKSSELDKTIKQYLISCIDWSNYVLDKEPVTVQEKVDFLRDTFELEMDWRIAQEGQQSAAQAWLQGLCSACSIEYRNSEILLLAIQWGSLSGGYTDKQAEKVLENYWQLMAVKLCHLFNGYRLPKE